MLQLTPSPAPCPSMVAVSLVTSAAMISSMSAQSPFFAVLRRLRRRRLDGLCLVLELGALAAIAVAIHPELRP